LKAQHVSSGTPLETCWAFNERWNNKFYYKVASCWLFLPSTSAIIKYRYVKPHTKFQLPSNNGGAWGEEIGWSTALKARKSLVWFPLLCFWQFSIGMILRAALCLWGLTQPLTEMSIRNISWGVKATGAEGWQSYHFHVHTVLKSVSLNQLEPSGPAQASTGNALPLPRNNGELVITFKLKAKENIFTWPSSCYFILHKNMTLTKVECFPRCYYL
jgi:hypothetical protein